MEPIPGMGKKSVKRGRGERGFTVKVECPYVQIPHALVRDNKISRSARFLYGAFHGVCFDEKHLMNNPKTYFTQKRMSKLLNCTPQSIYNWMRELKESGWITVLQNGWLSNQVTLHPKPKRRRKIKTKKEKQMLKDSQSGKFRRSKTA